VSQAETKTILIVEDNDLNMRLFNDLLRASGYQTLASTDGREALALTESHHPDLILMDMRLPGMSGLDITRMIKAREHLRHIPVVAITASALKGEEQMYLDEGCDAFIAKPISIPRFLDTIERLLAENA